MKKNLFIVCIVLAAIGVGFLLGRTGRVPSLGGIPALEIRQEQDAASQTPTPSMLASAAPLVSPPAKKQAPLPTPAPSPETRMLFTNCSPSPSSLHLSANTRFIVENTDATSRKITVGDDQTLIVQPHSAQYAYARPLGILSVTCDGLGVGTVFAE